MLEVKQINQRANRRSVTTDLQPAKFIKRAKRDERIEHLRERIKDSSYLETAMKKLASDLAQEFF